MSMLDQIRACAKCLATVVQWWAFLSLWSDHRSDHGKASLHRRSAQCRVVQCPDLSLVVEKVHFRRESTCSAKPPILAQLIHLPINYATETHRRRFSQLLIDANPWLRARRCGFANSSMATWKVTGLTHIIICLFSLFHVEPDMIFTNIFPPGGVKHDIHKFVFF